MIKSIELTFNGNFSDGFNVFLVIQAHDSKGRIPIHRLESEPKIPELYKNWKKSYLALDQALAIAAIPDQVTNISIEECKTQARELGDCFRTWLGSRNFGKIREKIISHIASATEVRVFLASDDKLLQRLPWHLLDLFDHPHIEVSLIPLDYSKSNLVRPPSNNNILAVFGADQGIDLKGDIETMLALSNSNPPVFLTKPEVKTLQKQLGEGQWDILFFSGHSGTRLNGGVNEGVICVNETEPPPTIEDLKTVLQNAIRKGLKLAIFNSCDGIELAEALLELKIPQVVVMREPVANEVAEEFLKHFLKAFSNGESLDLAVRHARRELQSLEIKFPCASWLPMIYQNPAEDSLIWKPDTSITGTTKKIPKTLSRNIKFLSMLILGIVLAVIFIPLILQPQVDPVNARISYGEKFLIDNKFITDSKKIPLRNSLSADAFDPKNWVGTISKFKTYLYNTDQNITSKTQLQKNDPEALIYLNNAIAEKNGKYVTIAVSVPIVEETPYLMGVSQEILRGVAQVQNEVNQGEEKQLINGNFLKVVLAKDDNASKNDDVVKAIAKKFVKDENILAVVGHNSTKASLAAADTYKDQLLAISPTSNGEKLSEKKYYRILPSIATDAGALARHATESKSNKIGICFDKSDESSKSLKESFVSKFTENGKTTIGDGICDSLKEMTKDKAKEIIQKFTDESVEALFLNPSIQTIPNAVEIAKANKNNLRLIANSTMYTQETLILGQDSVKGMVLVTVWHPNFNFVTESFAEKSKGLWAGDVNWRTATSYDATKVIVEGLKERNPSRKSLMNFVADKRKLSTTTGIGDDKMSFYDTGARNTEIRLIQINDNLKFVPFPESASSNNKN